MIDIPNPGGNSIRRQQRQPSGSPPQVTMVSGDTWVVSRRGLCRPREGYGVDLPEKAQIRLAMKWLTCRIGDTGRIKTPTISSYSLKHSAERWSGRYISNGAMIFALARLGFPMRVARRQCRQINAMAGVSWRWYRRLEESQLVEAMSPGWRTLR